MGVLRGQTVGRVVGSMRHDVPRGLCGSLRSSCARGPEDISVRTLRCGRRSCGCSRRSTVRSQSAANVRPKICNARTIENSPRVVVANDRWAYGVQVPWVFPGSQETAWACRTGSSPQADSLGVTGGSVRACVANAHSYYCSNRYCDLGQDGLDRDKVRIQIYLAAMEPRKSHRRLEIWGR
jgi:hypothetical protein